MFTYFACSIGFIDCIDSRDFEKCSYFGGRAIGVWVRRRIGGGVLLAEGLGGGASLYWGHGVIAVGFQRARRGKVYM